MTDAIEPGFMVFLAEGQEGIGAVRRLEGANIVIYVENAGEFVLKPAQIAWVHDKKVVLKSDGLDARLTTALKHVHDAEDPKLTG